MHFLIWDTLSFNLMYVAACYLVGTGMCHNMVGLLQHYTNVAAEMAATCLVCSRGRSSYANYFHLG